MVKTAVQLISSGAAPSGNATLDLRSYDKIAIQFVPSDNAATFDVTIGGSLDNTNFVNVLPASATTTGLTGPQIFEVDVTLLASLKIGYANLSAGTMDVYFLVR